MAIFVVTSFVVIIDLTKGILAVEARISFGDLNIKSICDVMSVNKRKQEGGVGAGVGLTRVNPSLYSSL